MTLADRLQTAQLRLAGLALLVMMMVTVFDVTLRYLLNRPIAGTYDLVECMMAVLVFHGMAATFIRRGNIVIDLMDHLVSERLVVWLIRLSDILSIACLLVLFWAMTGPAWQAYQYGDVKLELGLPIYWLWVVALSGMVGTILCALVALTLRVTLSSDRRPA